jgi:hypothetical protein
MGLWLLVRALRQRRDGRGGASSRGSDEPSGGSARVIAAAVGVGLAVIALSVVLGGTAVWAEYAQVIGAGTRAVIVDPRNSGIAALVATFVGGGDELARMLHLAVGAGALVVTAWAAWRRPDSLESFAWATAASLVTLPVTWYHYPSAMIPIAIAAGLRAHGASARPVRGLLIAAGVVAAIAIAALPLVYVAIGLVIAAARRPGEASPVEIRPVRSLAAQPGSSPEAVSDVRAGG